MLRSTWPPSTTMSPPPPINCEVPGCTFATEENIPTHELRMARLTAHIQMAHIIPNSTPRPTEPPPQRQKPATIPRPELELDATDQDWAHFKVKWERYKRSCLQGMEPSTIIDHLLASCSNELENAIWKQEQKNPDSEAELLRLMENLGVRKHNVLLNKVAFLDMSQNSGKPVKLFVS